MSKAYSWLNVSGCWTRTLSLGQVLLPCAKWTAEKNSLILIIPGNPGIDEFYEHFAENLNARTKFPVWVVSHFNHVPVPPELATKTSNMGPILLAEQIEHKLNFVKKFVPKSVNLYLIGHSIGCYMILKILSHLELLGFQVPEAFLLFPTIQHLAESPNGRFSLKARQLGIHYLIMVLPYVMYWLPSEIKKYLIKSHLEPNAPECIIQAAENLFDWHVAKNVITMGYNELDTVGELPEKSIIENQEKLVFYYGLSDGWCPIEYGKKLREKFPHLKVIFCEKDCEHAFVIGSGHIIAEILSQLIVTK